MEYIDLPDGTQMPIIGLGTWQILGDPLEKAVETALETGYRHIDTAYMYENEEQVGNVLGKWLGEGKVRREEIFITTKLPMIGMREDLVEHFMRLSLKALRLDYVDLYLIHSPVGFKYIDDQTLIPFNEEKLIEVDMSTDLEKIWKGMENLVSLGLTKSIGISNFSIDQQERIVKAATIQPSNHQMELHACFRRKPLLEACRKHGISVVSYASLGSPGRQELFKMTNQSDSILPRVLDHPVVKDIAKKHNKTPAQVLLRHLLQQNIAIIPKSVNPHRIKENFQVFDFELDTSDMQELDKLDRGEAGRSFSMKANKPGTSKHPECKT